MALEDFTTYTEVDPDTCLTVTANKIAAVDLDGDFDTYVYADKGASHFGATFDHDFKFTTGAHSAQAWAIVWAVSNSVDDALNWYSDQDEALVCWLGVDADRIILWNMEDRSSDYWDLGSDWAGIPYYLSANRTSETTMSIRIYSDSGRTTLIDTISVSVTSGRRYRYVFGLNSRNAGTGGKNCTLDVEDLDLQEGASATAFPANLLLLGTGGG